MDGVPAIDVANQQNELSIDEGRLKRAVRMIVEDESIRNARISVAVVDDATIRRLNRRYLDHDDPTDVLAFVLERTGDFLEGEIVVSAEAALGSASRFGWSGGDELLLYVIHGMLHLAGCDDRTAAERAAMRAREREYLGRFDLEPQYEELDEPEHDRSRA